MEALGTTGRRWGQWLFAVAIFLGAFLLFQVQPIISKAILPWFGGSPAVWTTCMLFFQVLLLGGYAYAHWLARFPRAVWPVPLHMALLALAFVFLPVLPGAFWKPDGTEQPTIHILLLLICTVGLPYFLLASTGPLLQSWYFGWSSGASPYRLYALSNLGSLGALVSYPFLVEPVWGTRNQAWAWSIGFAVFALSCGIVGLEYRRVVKLLGDAPMSSAAAQGATQPTRWNAAIWLTLPAFASVLLLAVTNHVCQDVAVVPFLWILPLSLYLLSFIICFDRPFWYRPMLFSLGLLLGLSAIAMVMLGTAINEQLEKLYESWGWFADSSIPWYAEVPDFLDTLLLEVSLYMLVLFCLCMLCHGEVVRRKPGGEHLTRFYLMIATGGALGGITVAVICPLIFSMQFELPIGMVLSAIMAIVLLTNPLGKLWGRTLQLGATAAVFALLPSIISAQMDSKNMRLLAARRNFYGTLRIEERGWDSEATHKYSLYNGRILHGLQLQDEFEKMTPSLYYSYDSGVGLAITWLPTIESKRVGAVGLGAGMLAAYAEPGDHYTFYEINPQVKELNEEWFTFVTESPATIDIELGDARLTLERQEVQSFDVLALDAFTGDAIPVHLLTREAFAIYQRQLAPDGVLAVHISNRHLDLIPVVAAAAQYYRWRLLYVESDDSDWLLLTKNDYLIDALMGEYNVEEIVELDQPPVVWTDDYSSLWGILETVKSWKRWWRGE